tara:strand:+ start:105 stop:680 length:576 start_codon:yes stop_codon:yes gene_type:complete
MVDDLPSEGRIYVRRKRKKWYKTIAYQDAEGKMHTKGMGPVSVDEAKEIQRLTKGGENLASAEMLLEAFGDHRSAESDGKEVHDSGALPGNIKEPPTRPRVPPWVDLPELDPVMERFVESYKSLLGALACLELKFPEEVAITRMVVNLKDGFDSLKGIFPGFLRYRDATVCTWPVRYPLPPKPEDMLYPSD